MSPKPKFMQWNLWKTAGVIGVFAVGFALLVGGTKWVFAEKEVAQTSTQLDRHKALAFSAYNRRQFDVAIPYFDQLLVSDPYDGYAMFMRAECLRKMFYNKSIRPELYTDDQIQAAAESAIEAYEAVAEFPRFRREAHFSLGVLHARQKNFETALDLLGKSIGTGAHWEDMNVPGRTIYDFYFEFIRRDREFIRLARDEMRSWRNGLSGVQDQRGEQNNPLDPEELERLRSRKIERMPAFGG